MYNLYIGTENSLLQFKLTSAYKFIEVKVSCLQLDFANYGNDVAINSKLLWLGTIFARVISSMNRRIRKFRWPSSLAQKIYLAPKIFTVLLIFMPFFLIWPMNILRSWAYIQLYKQSLKMFIENHTKHWRLAFSYIQYSIYMILYMIAFIHRHSQKEHAFRLS